MASPIPAEGSERVIGFAIAAQLQILGAEASFIWIREFIAALWAVQIADRIFPLRLGKLAWN
jgi:hypothetical protein